MADSSRSLQTSAVDNGLLVVAGEYFSGALQVVAQLRGDAQRESLLLGFALHGMHIELSCHAFKDGFPTVSALLDF